MSSSLTESSAPQLAGAPLKHVVSTSDIETADSVSVASMEHAQRHTAASALFSGIISSADKKSAAANVAADFKKLITDIRILASLAQVITESDAKVTAEAGYLTVAAIAEAMGTAAEPFLVSMLSYCLDGGKKKSSKAEAEAAMTAVIAICRSVTPFSIDTVMPVLLTGAMPDQFYRTRQAALEGLSVLVEVGPDCIGESLPNLVPILEKYVHDTRAEVKNSARTLLAKAINVVVNKDIEDVVPFLAPTIIDFNLTLSTIHKLSATIFVRSVTTPCMAILVPLLLRGMNEKTTATKRITARIIANMSKLVDEPIQARPLLPALLPALEQASESVSDPEARQVCTEAYEQLVRLNEACKVAPPTAKLEEEDALQVLRSLLNSATDPVLDKALAYLAKNLQSLVAHRAFAPEQWSATICPIITAFTDSETASHVAASALSIVQKKLAITDEVAEDNDDAEELCNCQFTLAYGTKILLHNTTMKLKRGYRYGLLGGNDSGKTTLMRAIANGQVEGFPDKTQVRTVFVEADIQGELSHMSCIEYIMVDDRIKNCGASREQVSEVMASVGFTDQMQNNGVHTLSGGWRMKLALARAMLQKADILLLDEPTNHLDVINVAWVQNYLLNLKDVTSIIVSHDVKLLDNVCNYILQIDNLRLKLFKGNLSAFVAKNPSAKSYFEMKTSEPKFRFKFPQPGRLEGIKRKGRALMKMDDVTFTYPCNTVPTISNVTVQVSMCSRVACVGVNGAGKSTLIKILTGELEPTKGTVWKYPYARIAYVAQHAFHHIESHLDKTPNEYIQWRYANDEDKETLDKVTMVITPEEEAICSTPFEFSWKEESTGKILKAKRVIERLTGARRDLKDKSQEYEVKFEGLDLNHNAFMGAEKLSKMGFTKHMFAVDTKIAARTGMLTRPLTRGVIEQHFRDIGLEPEFASHTLIGALSGGQKVKVVIAAAMWNQPHILILDEPTNYLDRESLLALAAAIEEWEGGVVMITHNNEFCSALCPETWVMEHGKLDCQGDPEWMKNAESKAIENVEITEMVDGAGNLIKAKPVKKELSRKDKKAKLRAIKNKQKDGFDITESEDEFLNDPENQNL